MNSTNDTVNEVASCLYYGASFVLVLSVAFTYVATFFAFV